MKLWVHRRSCDMYEVQDLCEILQSMDPRTSINDSRQIEGWNPRIVLNICIDVAEDIIVKLEEKVVSIGGLYAEVGNGIVSAEAWFKKRNNPKSEPLSIHRTYNRVTSVRGGKHNESGKGRLGTAGFEAGQYRSPVRESDRLVSLRELSNDN